MEVYDVPIGFEESTLDREHSDYDFETNLPAEGIQRMESPDGQVKITVTARRTPKPKQHLITVNFEDKRLGDVLDIIVKQMENYRWEISREVVNIVPIRGRDLRYEKLLTLNISHFFLKNGSEVGDIKASLSTLPELRKFLIENKLHCVDGHAGPLMVLENQLGRKIESEMSYSNLTFLELLNQITRVKRGGWIIKKDDTFGSESEEYIDIDI